MMGPIRTRSREDPSTVTHLTSESGLSVKCTPKPFGWSLIKCNFIDMLTSEEVKWKFCRWINIAIH